MKEQPRHDHTLLKFFAALFVFNSPLTNWWSSLQLPWYAIFIFWAIFIALVALNLRQKSSSDGD